MSVFEPFQTVGIMVKGTTPDYEHNETYKEILAELEASPGTKVEHIIEKPGPMEHVISGLRLERKDMAIDVDPLLAGARSVSRKFGNLPIYLTSPYADRPLRLNAKEAFSTTKDRLRRLVMKAPSITPLQPPSKPALTGKKILKFEKPTRN